MHRRIRIFGIGFGFVNAPITNAAVSGMPREQAGVAAAIATTSRQFGQAHRRGDRRRDRGLQRRGSRCRATSAPIPPGGPSTASGAVVLVLGLLATGHAGDRVGTADCPELNPEALAA